MDILIFLALCIFPKKINIIAPLATIYHFSNACKKTPLK